MSNIWKVKSLILLQPAFSSATKNCAHNREKMVLPSVKVMINVDTSCHAYLNKGASGKQSS